MFIKRTTEGGNYSKFDMRNCRELLKFEIFLIILRQNITILIITLLTYLNAANAQMPGVLMAKGAKKVEIPFERQDNFIIVKVLLQNFLPLRFIVDTGAEHTLLTKKEITTLLDIPFERTITLMGTDMRTQIIAHIARKVTLGLTNITFEKDILVLDDDYLHFDRFSGLEVHGVLGAEIFRGFVVKFDFVKQVMTIYDPSVFKPSDHRKYDEFPIEITRSKPYMVAAAHIQSDSTVQLKLLVDTGASLSMLLHTYSTPGLVLPSQTIRGSIGMGLGGDIEGVVGRIRDIEIGGHRLVAPVCNFHQLSQLSDSSFINHRNGLIGSEILTRFNMIIDFTKEKMYVQANRYFKNTFTYDRSGLSLITSGANLKQFLVQDILENSPASNVDIRIGDEIVKINWLPARLHTLSTMNDKLQGKIGKTIRLTLLRHGQKIHVKFKLKELI
ncbi:MAG: aspartyl protease family protein [Saprospiraceae bacterium]|nr:aspartyl protease family protein [Saprospiraceae bacterium]